MFNTKSKFSRVCYIIATVSIILIIAIFFDYFHELKKTSEEIKKETHMYDAQIISNYMNEFFQERETTLSILSTYLADININDKEVLSELLSPYNSLFDNITLIDIDGSFIYGGSKGENIKNEDGFKSALRGQSIIANDFTKSYNEKNELYMYMPVIDKNKRVKMVLSTSFLDSTLSKHIEKKFSDSDTCVAVLNGEGKLMYGNNNTINFLGKPGTSYFFFIKACDIITKDIYPDDIRNDISEQKEIFIEYKYSKQQYTCACIPTGVNGFYIAYITKDNKFGLEKNIYSKSNIMLFRILLIGMILIFGLLFYNIKSRTKTAELLNKYEIIDKQDGVVLFEYTFYPKKFQMYGDSENLFGKKFNTMIGDEVYDVYNIVHKEDASVRGRLHEFFDSDRDTFSSEIRLLHTNGKYHWFRITGIVFRNDIGQCLRFIGKLANVNKQVSMEKKLVKRAENDLLTGVLNKKTIEARITEILKNNHDGRNYIFYMVDLDNFKNVNDTLGHIFGDKAISDTANVLTEIFHDNAYIGRLGGDEFAVCAIYDAFDEESLMKFIEDHAEQICQKNRREYSDGVNTVKISSSVGIAIGPRDGQTFEMLYTKADECLYKSKKAGKNKYTIFNHYTVFNR